MSEKPPARVVLIEDHTMVRQLLVHLVRDELRLNLVADCADGTVAVPRENPDLVVADSMLPDGRGFDVLRATAAQPPRTRWMFMSSNEQGHLVREAVSLGAHGFVMKRADFGTFRTAIARVLAGEKYYCAESSRLLVDRLADESPAVGVNHSMREREVLRGFARGRIRRRWRSGSA